jgi:hypothetical protein
VPKITIEFNTEAEDFDLQDYYQYIHAPYLAHVIYQMDSKLRQIVRYEDDAPAERIKLAEELREYLREQLMDYDVPTAHLLA